MVSTLQLQTVFQLLSSFTSPFALCRPSRQSVAAFLCLPSFLECGAHASPFQTSPDLSLAFLLSLLPCPFNRLSPRFSGFRTLALPFESSEVKRVLSPFPMLAFITALYQRRLSLLRCLKGCCGNEFACSLAIKCSKYFNPCQKAC